MSDNTKKESYDALGVSATKDEVHEVIDNMDAGLYPGAFCKILPDTLTNDDEYCLVMHADGAGTKSTLAYLAWKETGDPKWFRGIATDSLIMNLDDMICIGATNGFILSNTIGRNAHRISGAIIKEIVNGYMEDIADLNKLGIQIEMAGGETADVGDLVQTVIVDSTLTVRMKRADVIDCNNVTAGDVIIGFSSTGKATYEEKENSGIGSNGLTAARHEVLSKYYAEKYPESFSPTIPSENVFRGKYKLEDKLNEAMTVGEALLSPTRTYAPIIKKILDTTDRQNIHGIVHCTGGGLQKCNHFGNNITYIKDNLFETPDLFKLIQNLNYMKLKEMYKVFNMGQLLELYCPKECAQNIIEISNQFGVEAKIVGHCEENPEGNKTIITCSEGTFEY
ncbi:MAG: phosphoribosylformylglycinamidine cyclo-ligase [Planctomycetota bacterium]|nr:MAG: phosphoribosylformylglycinamidine cyclo-ligase [Planctomycetota bacterium]